MPGELLTIWTARFVVACWAGRTFVDVAAAPASRCARWACWLWTLGCAIYLAHIAAAFEYYHEWSHQAAWEHTARRSAEAVGLEWGGGIWFNYVAAVLWPLDVWLLWRSRMSRRVASEGSRTRVLHRVTYAWLTFPVVNATIVFGPPLWKWAAAVWAGVLAITVVCRRRETRAGEHAERVPTSGMLARPKRESMPPDHLPRTRSP